MAGITRCLIDIASPFRLLQLAGPVKYSGHCEGLLATIRVCRAAKSDEQFHFISLDEKGRKRRLGKQKKNRIICDIKSKFAAICVCWRERMKRFRPRERATTTERKLFNSLVFALVFCCNNSFIFRFNIYLMPISCSFDIFLLSRLRRCCVYNLLYHRDFCSRARKKMAAQKGFGFIWHD